MVNEVVYGDRLNLILRGSGKMDYRQFSKMGEKLKFQRYIWAEIDGNQVTLRGARGFDDVEKLGVFGSLDDAERDLVDRLKFLSRQTR